MNLEVDGLNAQPKVLLLLFDSSWTLKRELYQSVAVNVATPDETLIVTRKYHVIYAVVSFGLAVVEDDIAEMDRVFHWFINFHVCS